MAIIIIGYIYIAGWIRRYSITIPYFCCRGGPAIATITNGTITGISADDTGSIYLTDTPVAPVTDINVAGRIGTYAVIIAELRSCCRPAVTAESISAITRVTVNDTISIHLPYTSIVIVIIDKEITKIIRCYLPIVI